MSTTIQPAHLYWLPFTNPLHQSEFELLKRHCKASADPWIFELKLKKMTLFLKFQKNEVNNAAPHAILLSHLGKAKPFEGHVDQFNHREAVSFWMMELLNAQQIQAFKLQDKGEGFRWYTPNAKPDEQSAQHQRFQQMIRDSFRPFQLDGTHAAWIQAQAKPKGNPVVSFDIALRNGLMLSISEWYNYALERVVKHNLEEWQPDGLLERCLWLPRYLSPAVVMRDEAEDRFHKAIQKDEVFSQRVGAMEALWNGEYALFLKRIREVPESSFTTLNLPLWFVPFAMVCVEGNIESARNELINLSLVDGLGLYTAYHLWAVCCEQHGLHDEARDARTVASKSRYANPKPLPTLNDHITVLQDYARAAKTHLEKITEQKEVTKLLKAATEEEKLYGPPRTLRPFFEERTRIISKRGFFEDEEDVKKEKPNPYAEKSAKLLARKFKLLREIKTLDHALEARYIEVMKHYGPVFFQHWKQQQLRPNYLDVLDPYAIALQNVWRMK